MDKTADESGLTPVPVPENATEATESARADTGESQVLPAEAERALAEAAARRDKAAAAAKNLPLGKSTVGPLIFRTLLRLLVGAIGNQIINH